MKRSLLLILLTFLPLMVNAYDACIDGIYYNIIPKGNVAEVTKNPNKYTGSIVLPNSIIYNDVNYNVANIGKDAFNSCSNLVSITIPENVVKIGESAFAQCTSLESIIIPKHVTTIGKGAFQYCRSLNTIIVEEGNKVYDSRFNCNAIIETESNKLVRGCNNTIIPDGTTCIGEYAFDRCNSLSAVTIPNSVTTIENNAFEFCSGLTAITIPNSVCNIGREIFSYCTGLSSISIGNGLKSISSDAFLCCKALKSVTIPDNIIEIGAYAFWGCNNLTSITFGSEVKSIGTSAFYKCSELKTVCCFAKNIPDTNNNAFAESYIEYATLYVPESAVELYQTTSPWSGFGNIVPLTDDEVDGIEEPTPNPSRNGGEVYDLDGRRIQQPHNGIYIKNGKKVAIK